MRPHSPSSHRLADPFGPKPDKRYYYAFEAFEQRIAVLRRLLQGADALMLVIGERGSGKTTMLQRILNTIDAASKPCRVQTAASSAIGRLSRLRQRAHPTAFLLQMPGNTVILMDDAHQLSRKELRKLLQNTLASGPDAKFKRMVLFGEPRLSADFETVSGGLIDETAVNKIFLPTVSEEEAAAYLRHRLAVAGFNGKSPFSATTLKALYRDSQGLPGRINENASRWLSKKGLAGRRSRQLPRGEASRYLRVAGWTIAGALIIFAAVFFLLPPLDTGYDSQGTAAPKVVRGKIRSIDRQLKPRADVASGRPAEKQLAARPQPTAPEQPGKVQPPPVPDSRAPKPPSTTPPASKQPDSGKYGRIQREQWLLAQRPSDYTIQLLGVRSEQSLLAFVNQYGLDQSGDAAYYRSRFKGGIWYPLVYGVYANPKQAQSAIAGLPEKIRSMSPWIRKMSAVQSEIRKAASP